MIKRHDAETENQKGVYPMATSFPTAKAEKKKKNKSLSLFFIFSPLKFFGLVSGVLCGFYDVVGLEI